MSRYYNVRGFIDCEFEELDEIRAIAAAHRGRAEEFGLTAKTADLYASGWLFQGREINWTAHAFFGAEMRIQGVEFILAQLRSVASALPESEGLFVVNDDESGPTVHWKIGDGHVAVASTGASPSDAGPV